MVEITMPFLQSWPFMSKYTTDATVTCLPGPKNKLTWPCTLTMFLYKWCCHCVIVLHMYVITYHALIMSSFNSSSNSDHFIFSNCLKCQQMYLYISESLLVHGFDSPFLVQIKLPKSSCGWLQRNYLMVVNFYLSFSVSSAENY